MEPFFVFSTPDTGQISKWETTSVNANQITTFISFNTLLHVDFSIYVALYYYEMVDVMSVVLGFGVASS